MNVVVFGASGGTGHEVVKQALAQGHSVTAFVRDPARFDINHPHLKVVQGDVADYASIERAVNNQDAVICALGSSTPLTRDPTLIDGVRNIIKAMESAGARRLIYLSFLGVRDGRDQLSFLGKYIIAPLVLRNVVADHEAKEALIKQSRLNWIIVRPPRLTKGRRSGAYRSGERIVARSIIPTISRADVADLMLKQLTDDRYLHKTVSTDDMQLAVIEYGGVTKAYPLDYVIHHHIINDRFGDRIVALTCCAMCRTIIPFDVTDNWAAVCCFVQEREHDRGGQAYQDFLSAGNIRVNYWSAVSSHAEDDPLPDTAVG